MPACWRPVLIPDKEKIDAFHAAYNRGVKEYYYNVALASDYIKTNYNLENYNDYIFKSNSYSRVNEAVLKRLKEKK